VSYQPTRQPNPGRWWRRAAIVAALSASGLFVATAVAVPAQAAEAPIKAGTARAIPGQYIVVLKDGTDAAATARSHGIQPRFVYSATIDGFAAALSPAQLARVRSDRSVAYVSPDGVASISGKPTPDGTSTSLTPPAAGAASDVTTRTTQPGATWGIDRVDQRIGINGTYNYTTTGAGVRAYVIDTGIYTAHSQFGGRASVGFDAFGGNGQDCHGHGTHVAGTIGGATYGLAKSVSLTAVRVLNCAGSGSYAGVIAGIDWVTYNHNGPSVANMSLGGGFSAPVNDAVTKSIAHGVTYAVAAGNENQNACNVSPASTPGALTVGATGLSGSTDVRASFSNWGGCVDVFDPGVSITSAWIGSPTAINTISGTSMAAPHVAGLVALYLQANPYATPALVNDVVKSTAVAGIVSNPAGSPNLFARKWNGILTGTGNSSYQPDGSYWLQGSTGYIQGWLAGTAGTDPDLYLYRWNGSAWSTSRARRASPRTSGSSTWAAPASTRSACTPTPGRAASTSGRTTRPDAGRGGWPAAPATPLPSG
jgi:subtilisin family serine protease